MLVKSLATFTNRKPPAQCVNLSLKSTTNSMKGETYMLEIYNNDSITIIEDLKDFITVIFVIVDDIYQEVTPTYIKNRRNSNHSIMSDSEIITVSLAGELMSIDSENAYGFF